MVELVRQNFKENKKLYKKIEKNLRQNLDKTISISHVGSTAIPNMWGKNIIDILIGAKDNEEFNQIKSVLERLDFSGSEKSKDEIYQFFSSTENETKAGDVHIHLVINDTQRYSDFIILKNYLLNNKNEAKNYSDLKRNLIKNNVTDRKEYKSIKSKYVSDLLERARKNDLLSTKITIS